MAEQVCGGAAPAVPMEASCSLTRAGKTLPTAPLLCKAE